MRDQENDALGRGPAVYIVQLAVLAAVYFGAAKLGLTMAFVAEQVTAVWPPTGIALAAVLLFGYRVWPGIALGAFLANATANEPLATAAGIAVGNTLEAIVGAWALRRLGFAHPLERLRDVLGLLVLAAGVSTAVSATIGTTSLCLGGVQPWSAYGAIWGVWWLGDALGDLVVAPALLTCVSGIRQPWPRHRVVEVLALLLAVLAMSGAIFGEQFTIWPVYPLAYLIFPFVIWAALRFGPPGSASVTLLASGVAVWGTVNGYGPFVEGTVHVRLILLQIFMGVVAVTGLVLAAMTSERQQAGESMRVSEERFRLLVQGVRDYAIFMLDPGGHVVSWNSGAQRIKGYRTEEILGRHVSRFYPPEGIRAGNPQEGLAVAAERGTYEEETWQLRKDGSRFIASVLITALRDEAGRLRGFAQITRDITRRKELEREVLQIATWEERRIGQELHDSVGQELTGLGLMADALAQRLLGSSADRELAAKIVAGLERAHQQVRSLSHGLAPVEVSPEGLRSALEDLAARTSEPSGTACTFESAGPVEVADTVTATHLFRIAQEAVSNSLRHGRARGIRVTLGTEATPDILTLSVQDDGVGIPAAPEDGKGVGIRLMRYRAAVIGGTLTIGPAPEGGTLVTCTFPRDKRNGSDRSEHRGQARQGSHRR